MHVAYGFVKSSKFIFPQKIPKLCGLEALKKDEFEKFTPKEKTDEPLSYIGYTC